MIEWLYFSVLLWQIPFRAFDVVINDKTLFFLMAEFVSDPFPLMQCMSLLFPLSVDRYLGSISRLL